MEPLENGQVAQQTRRRPAAADAWLRTTPGFFHSHALGLAGPQGAPKTRGSSSRPTPNGDHDNGSLNGLTALRTTRQRRQPRTAWDLPELIRPLPVRRSPCPKRPRVLVHYPAVVEYVFGSRLATASQIRRRFPDYLGPERTAQYQLANLVHLGYLATASVRSTSPNFPFVFLATGRGVGLVRKTYAALGRPWTAAPTEQARAQGQSLDSILHELLLTEFDLAVASTLKHREDLARLFSERRYFRRNKQLRFFHQGRLHRVIPDAGFLLRQAFPTPGRPDVPRASLLLHLVELDNGTMSLARIREKYGEYARWAGSDAGRDYLHRLYQEYGATARTDNFRLLVIAHDKARGEGDRRRLVDLFGQALALPSPMRDRIWLTTVEDLKRHQDDRAPLDAAIWLRLRDARPWLPRYREELATLPPTRVSAYYAFQRRFVGPRLADLPRHPLFARPSFDSSDWQ